LLGETIASLDKETLGTAAQYAPVDNLVNNFRFYSLRPSAYLCVLCVEDYFNTDAENAELLENLWREALHKKSQ